MSERSGNPEELDELGVEPEDLLNVQWSLGTTADPKAYSTNHSQWFGGPINALTNEGDRVLEIAPLVNMTALGAMYVPCLEASGTLVLRRPLDIQFLIHPLSTKK
jgi:acyl-CoA synthetase (AMP-forming)/AMP-acid ligase II